MIEWHIPTMTCGHCAGVVTKTVKAADPQAQVTIDLATRTVRLETAQDTSALSRALSQEGYAPVAAAG